MKTLVLFTSFFPFGTGEAFLESELPFLYKEFERVIIVTNDVKTKKMREIPPNVILIRYPYHSSFYYKMQAVFSITSELFANEVKFIREKLRLSIHRSVLYTLLGSIAKGYETRDFITEKIMKKYSLDFSNTWFYAYWMNDMAIGLAMLKEKFPEAKTLCRAHRGDLYFYTTADYYQPLRRFLLKHLNKCYAISENGREHLVDLLGAEATSNVVVSRLGTFRYSQQPKFISSAVPVIVTCSTLTLPKRVPLVANALSKITSHRLKWLHFGDGVLFGGGELKVRIEKDVAKRLSGKETIEYKFMGNYSNKELMKFYGENQIDLFINVSSSEGIPVSIMEAMSFGIPVIATAAGGTIEAVIDGYNGYLLNVIATPGEIANSLTKFFNLPDTEKNRLAQNAFNMWDETYNAEKNYKQFIESILSL